MKLLFKALPIILFSLVVSLPAESQNAQVKSSSKMYAKRKKELKKAADKDEKEKVNQHLARQTKTVRERLKKSEESTDYHYRKRERTFFLWDLFHKNKNRNRRN